MAESVLEFAGSDGAIDWWVDDDFSIELRTVRADRSNFLCRILVYEDYTPVIERSFRKDGRAFIQVRWFKEVRGRMRESSPPSGIREKGRPGEATLKSRGKNPSNEIKVS